MQGGERALPREGATAQNLSDEELLALLAAVEEDSGGLEYPEVVLEVLEEEALARQDAEFWRVPKPTGSS
jgi:hypothetical protein